MQEMEATSLTSESASRAPRPDLSRERILTAAVSLADEVGVQAVTIRRLADTIGTKPMSLYHYVAGKDDILNGMVDTVFAEITLPPEDLHWKESVRVRCVSARQVLNRHPWAPPLMESRTSPGPSTLQHHEALLECLHRGGLSWQMTAHAAAVLDSYVYGFTMQEANLPFGGQAEIGGLAEQILGTTQLDAYPTLGAFTREHVLQPGYSFGGSFEFGLDLLLDGLERAAVTES